MLKDRRIIEYNIWVLRIVSFVLAIVLTSIIIYARNQVKTIDEKMQNYGNKYLEVLK